MPEQAELQPSPEEERSPEEQDRAAAYADMKGQLEWQLKQVVPFENGDRGLRLVPGSTIDTDYTQGIHVDKWEKTSRHVPDTGMSVTFETGDASWLKVTFPDHGDPYCETYLESLNPVTHTYGKPRRRELSAGEISSLADTLGRGVNPRYKHD